jgi:hypothetical protein
MRCWIVAASVMLAAAHAHAGNFAECILDNMPGVANGQAAAAVARSCTREYPRQYSGVYKGVGLDWFGFKDSEACIIKKSRDTVQPYAAGMIAAACRCMYEPPAFDKQLCSE